MRILRVTQHLYPEVSGGASYHAHAMSRDQASRGHDVTTLTVSPGDNRPPRETRDGYTIVRCRPNASVLGNELSLEMASFLRSVDDFDVVHAHAHQYFATNLAALRRRFSEVPLAITNHGMYPQSAPRWLMRAYLATVGRWTYNAADVIFSYTPEDRDATHDFGIRTPIEVVPNGVDTARFSPDGPSCDRVDDDGFVVLFVGRLVDAKRPTVAVEAFERLLRSTPDASLYLAGDGPLADHVGRFVSARGLGDAVEVLGQVEYEYMPRLYRSADVLVLPSRSEGMPRTVLEALASETPVVTSDLPPVAPITERAGMAVSVDDIDGFASALHELAADPVRRCELGKRGRRLVVSNHDWADTVERTTDRLVSLVG